PLSTCGDCGIAGPDRQCSFAIFVFYAPLAKQNRCQYNGANTSRHTRLGKRRPSCLAVGRCLSTTSRCHRHPIYTARSRPPGLVPTFQPLANVAQSYGTEPFGPGLMSFHNVTLPSAPNLYSSVPSVGLVPWSHAAFWKMDEKVESGSCVKGGLPGFGGNLLTP